MKILQVQDKRQPRGEGLSSPTPRGQQGTGTALTGHRRLYKGANPPAHPKSKRQEAQRYKTSPLRGPAHCTLLELRSLPLCSRDRGGCASLGTGLSLPAPGRSGLAALGQDGSALADTALPRAVCRAGCLFPDNKLSARRPLREGPPPPPP